jgi:lipopolysaccharide export system permease protein
VTIFDRHIAWRLIKGYVLLILGLIVFFIVLHYVEFIDDFMDRGATMKDVFLTYYPNYIPEIVRLISPLALFLAAVHLTGRLAQKLEISTLQTSGVSVYRLSLSYVLVGVIITLFMFWFNGWVVPKTNRVRIAFEQEYTKDSTGQIEFSNIHRQNRPGSILSVGFFDRTTSTASSVSLHTFDENRRLVERIDAPRMTWQDSTKQWVFITPVIRRFLTDDDETLRTEEQLDTTLSILPRDLARSEGDMEAMTIDEGRDYLDELRRSGANRLGLPLVVYYSKFSYPLSNLILLLLSIPLASVRRRRGQAILLGTGLFIAFLYLAVMKLTEPFGYAGEISPLAAAWIPHLLFGAVALALLRIVRT